MDRSEASRALAQIIANLNVGNTDKAQAAWDRLKDMVKKEGLK